MAIQKFIVNGDEANIDYEGLVNKPFGDIVSTVVIPETTDTGFEYQSSFGAYVSMHMEMSPFPNIVLGKTYKVTYDGVEYECTAFSETFQSVMELTVLGSSIFSPTFDYPFAFIFMQDPSSGGAMIVGAQDTETTHTYKIEEIKYTTINPDYLPEYLRYGKETAQIITDQDYTYSNESP